MEIVSFTRDAQIFSVLHSGGLYIDRSLWRSGLPIAQLTLEMDRPNTVFSVAQHVEIRLGDAVVDDFDLEPQTPMVREIALGPDQLGEGQNVELGVRVFRAFVQPKQ